MKRSALITPLEPRFPSGERHRKPSGLAWMPALLARRRPGPGRSKAHHPPRQSWVPQANHETPHSPMGTAPSVIECRWRLHQRCLHHFLFAPVYGFRAPRDIKVIRLDYGAEAELRKTLVTSFKRLIDCRVKKCFLSVHPVSREVMFRCGLLRNAAFRGRWWRRPTRLVWDFPLHATPAMSPPLRQPDQAG